MIQYLLETIAFQMAFLLVYDLFLKKETFFQWNRFYLLGTFVLSIILPWIKIEALRTTVSSENIVYPEFLWQLKEVNFDEGDAAKTSFLESLTVYESIFILGVFAMTVAFFVKLFRIQNLRSKGEVRYHKEYTKITVRRSEMAFSFFRQVFLGDAIPSKKEPQILAHELVHIKQWHSLDLLFFELMRIIMWFNPMVYLYQRNMAELHEFMADAEVAKEDKQRQYQLLLSEAFQSNNISFVNQFFKSSLIKKRIVMLSKQKSSKDNLLKYALLLPLLLGMLVYSSCETEKLESSQFSKSVTEEGNLMTFKVYDLNNMTEEEKEEQANVFGYIEKEGKTLKLKIEDNFKNSMEIYYTKGVIENMQVFKDSKEDMVPFGVIDEVPLFPGCESAVDKKACFLENVQRHISKNFRYPQEAQERGIQGRVSVMFTINENGEITNIQKRGPHKLLEDEVVRIIKRLPRMDPGKQNGKSVKVPFSIPVNFVLDE